MAAVQPADKRPKQIVFSKQILYEICQNMLKSTLPVFALGRFRGSPAQQQTIFVVARKNRRNTRAHSAPFWNLWVACPPMPEKIVFHHVTRLHWCLTWRLPSCLRLASGLSLYFPTTVMELFVF
jgi:hypothetical protein